MYAVVLTNDETFKIPIDKCNSTFDNVLESYDYDKIWHILEKLSNDEIINLKVINIYHASNTFLNCFLPKNDIFIDHYLATIFCLTQRSSVELPVEVAQIILRMIINI